MTQGVENFWMNAQVAKNGGVFCKNSECTRGRESAGEGGAPEILVRKGGAIVGKKKTR